MHENFNIKLYNREFGRLPSRLRSFRKLYSDRSLISGLDIVNELDGHSGCVNALSWSKSGNLLASGSDDQHLNIHTYQPSAGTEQFQLTATVATGHTQNIFSVKFMPHSNDRTVITAAGDSQVRIFDLEYSGRTQSASNAASIAAEGRRRGRNNIYNSVRYLSDGDTNCRIYRSHGDRVKRIVTESSPHLFLTCSEDGEVRQWDLRQPSSAYPPPSRYGSNSSVPPPLISYKRYQLDLNTISCSPSQPHYIALGGAHLHAFLHDRRMTGRDRLNEAGKPLSSASHRSQDDEQLMNQATQCVRKFAPQGQTKMKRTENGHITACKISDARPNEMVVSWSGDHIYSFDLMRSPDASEEMAAPSNTAHLPESSRNKLKSDTEQHRKRKQAPAFGSDGEAGVARASPRPRTESEDAEQTSLRIRYRNGQTEEIPLSSDRGRELSQNSQRVLTNQQREAQRIAKASVKLRTLLFDSQEPNKSLESRFTEVIGKAAALLSDMDDVMRDWAYPMAPDQSMVNIQQTLRRNRESTRRFVQACGTVARVLGGRLQTPSGSSPMMASFSSVEARSNDLQLTRREHFGYDFIKAILLWLESGIGRLIEGFTRPLQVLPNTKAAQRLPIPEVDATIEAVDDILIPWLLELASDNPVVDVETNRFETDDNRHLFRSEKAAVLAFAAAIKIPFADLSSAVVFSEGSEQVQAQDRQTAMRYWGLKVTRGILLNAAEGVIFTFVDRAFGGLGRVIREVAAEEGRMDIIDEDEEITISNVELLNQYGEAVEGATAEDIAAAARESRHAGNDDANVALSSADHAFSNEIEEDDDEEGQEDDDDDDDDDEDYEENDDEGHESYIEFVEALDDDQDDEEEDDESFDTDEEDGVPNTGLPRFMYRSAFERRRLRERVEQQVPCFGSTKIYRGHCNVRTVKDVNYFGPSDEYVVSGSDDGNFFIWDQATGELVNVLEGDGEVVNVVQGHPYEPMLAVSGIDHTIKIFSPDARARAAARLGDGVSAHDASSFSSIAWPSRLGRRASRRSTTTATPSSEPAIPATNNDEDGDDDDEYVAPNGLLSRRRLHDVYRITQSNDVERQGGNQEALLTVSLLEQLAERIHQHRAAAVASDNHAGAGDGDDNDAPPGVDLGDECVLQ
ncbi:WD40 repeat-like protein [Acrodontium crateriforme]|uniref:WD40 repeat-like protein n=1 Tax=Acrodontium crateriforme TaxID=150365 RepID=A0AAQ3LZU4_9PEZI|nr:WD40 repeat-like protein [Acrodontium crateriforme]